MSAASAILCLTRFGFAHNLNPNSPFPIRSRKSISRSASAFDKTGLQGPRTVIKTVALGNARNGDEGVQALELQPFVETPTEFHDRESTVNRLSKWVMAGLFGAGIVWRHDGEAMWAATGAVVNAFLSFVLKRVLNQERPVVGLRSDPGMPSSHAQSIFFIVTFAVMSNMEWPGVNGPSLSLSFLVLALGSYFSWLRVSQQLHTFSQVLVGAVLGSAFSILWYLSWDAIVSEAFLSSSMVQMIVIFGGIAFCSGFAIYVMNRWFREE